jgi:hypothetical protein
MGFAGMTDEQREAVSSEYEYEDLLRGLGL